MRLSVATCIFAFVGYQAHCLILVRDGPLEGIDLPNWETMSMWNVGWDPLGRASVSTDRAGSTCEQLSSSREFKDNVAIPSAGMCKLAVINAGMPRTASTLVQQIIVDAISRVNKSIRTYGTYWNYHNHIVMKHKQKKQYVADVEAHLRNLDSEAVLTLKSHEFYEPLLSACRDTVVITSHRHPLDEMNSAVLAGWMSSRKDVVEAFRDWHAKQQCWISMARARGKMFMDIDFEAVKGETEGLRNLAQRMLAFVTSALKADPEPNSLQEFASHVQHVWGHAEANPNIPSKSNDTVCHSPHSNPEKCLEPCVRDAATELLDIASRGSQR